MKEGRGLSENRTWRRENEATERFAQGPYFLQQGRQAFSTIPIFLSPRPREIHPFLVTTLYERPTYGPLTN
jgi:hypothetical protein